MYFFVSILKVKESRRKRDRQHLHVSSYLWLRLLAQCYGPVQAQMNPRTGKLPGVLAVLRSVDNMYGVDGGQRKISRP